MAGSSAVSGLIRLLTSGQYYKPRWFG